MPSKHEMTRDRASFALWITELRLTIVEVARQSMEQTKDSVIPKFPPLLSCSSLLSTTTRGLRNLYNVANKAYHTMPGT